MSEMSKKCLGLDMEINFPFDCEMPKLDTDFPDFFNCYDRYYRETPDDKKCVVCGKELNKRNGWTCSQRCAGKLSQDKIYYKKLANQYSSPVKMMDMFGIITQIYEFTGKVPGRYNKERLDKFIGMVGDHWDDSLYCNKIKDDLMLNPRILSFLGGGVFHRLVDHGFIGPVEQVVVDCDNRLKTILNYIKCCNDARLDTYWGNLGEILLIEDELHKPLHRFFDVIYLDYCGWWNEEKRNEVERILFQQGKTNPYLLFITLNRSREHYKGESLVFQKDFNDIFQNQISTLSGNYCKLIYRNGYKNGKNIMSTYGFKVNNYNQK